MAHIIAAPDTTTNPDSLDHPASQPFTYYHAGALFDLAQLAGNVRLATAINKISNGRFQPILPQDIEQRDTTPHSIRDQDLQTLLSCDLALFTYDGTELDSGTVIEYMTAKFADVPAVILRTDFRGAGDQGPGGDPWNLMSSFWPRSVGVVVNSMAEYKTGLKNAKITTGSEYLPAADQAASEYVVKITAEKIVAAFEEVLKQPARLPKELRTSAYQWSALAPGFKFGSDAENEKQMLDLLHMKESKGLFN